MVISNLCQGLQIHTGLSDLEPFLRSPETSRLQSGESWQNWRSHDFYRFQWVSSLFLCSLKTFWWFQCEQPTRYWNCLPVKTILFFPLFFWCSLLFKDVSLWVSLWTTFREARQDLWTPCQCTLPYAGLPASSAFSTSPRSRNHRAKKSESTQRDRNCSTWPLYVFNYFLHLF